MKSSHGLLLALGVSVLSLFGACTSGGLVGGECATGYSRCGKQCVDLMSDVLHCGSCDYSCNSAQFCNSGLCRSDDEIGGYGGMAGTGGVAGVSGMGGIVQVAGMGGEDNLSGGTAGVGGVAGSGGDSMGGSGGDPTVGGAGSGGVAMGGTGGDGTGGAAGAGGGGTGGGSGSGGGGPTCQAPTVACGQDCVDTTSDPDHCGTCFKQCPSGLCSASQCLGSAPGHIVLLCTNLRQASVSSPPAVLLGNASMLPLNNLAANAPVRILAYSQYADAANVTHVNSVVSYAAGQRGRSVATTLATTEAMVTADLRRDRYEVFLIYDQPHAPASSLGAVGTSFAPVIDTFVGLGGTVILMSSGTSSVSTPEMAQLATNAGLLTMGVEQPVSIQLFYNRAPTDAAGLGVISPFLAFGDTCTFQLMPPADSKTVFVVTDSAPQLGLGNPLAVHRIP